MLGQLCFRIPISLVIDRIQFLDRFTASCCANRVDSGHACKLGLEIGTTKVTIGHDTSKIVNQRRLGLQGDLSLHQSCTMAQIEYSASQEEDSTTNPWINLQIHICLTLQANHSSYRRVQSQIGVKTT